VDVEPLDADGVLAVTVGAIAWAVAFVVLYVVFADELRAHDAQWWLAVCLVGAGLGIPGRWYAVRRRNAYRRAGGSDER
jgi:membrane protein DedA with SNARE-associated domain